MQIILQEDVDKLGHRGDVVTVKPGYARNFLLPNKFAIEATPGNMKALERIRGSLAKKTATELEAAKKQAELLSAVSLGRPAKTISSSARSRMAILLICSRRRASKSISARSCCPNRCVHSANSRSPSRCFVMSLPNSKSTSKKKLNSRSG